MEKILFLSHTESDGSLPKPALEALAAAVSLKNSTNDSTLIAGLFGGSVDSAANQIAGCGAGRILGVAGPDFDQARYASDAAAAEALCRAESATIIVAPATSRMARIMAGVTQRIQGRIDTHVTGIIIEGDSVSVTRWYYRQRMEAILQRTSRPWVILLDPGCYESWSGAEGAAAIEAISVELPDSCKRTRVIGYQSPTSGEQTIRPEAKVLLVAGAGWTKKQDDGAIHAEEAEKLILKFLSLAGASLGGSKSLVDLSGEGQAVLKCMTHLNQIGQTGATPRHPKGLSTCCHGEEPHAVGWRFINERRAVNLDPNCGWAQGKADVVYVADAFQVLTKVNELLQEK